MVIFIYKFLYTIKEKGTFLVQMSIYCFLWNTFLTSIVNSIKVRGLRGISAQEKYSGKKVDGLRSHNNIYRTKIYFLIKLKSEKAGVFFPALNWNIQLTTACWLKQSFGTMMVKKKGSLMLKNSLFFLN